MLVCGGMPHPAGAQTTLRLAETATVMVAPDELVASIRAESVAPTATQAQQQVNASISAALARARQVPGVAASTAAYDVWRFGPTSQDRAGRWQASQTVSLHSGDGAALLKLVGELQQMGLAVNQLAWQLAPETARKARHEATADALRALRGRADEAAGLLGLQFDSFKEVRLENPRPPILPRMMGAAAMSAAAPAPPSAEAEDVAVSATAEADVALKPR